MAFVPSHRLRAFILILALAFGLVGQAFVPAAMAMQPDHGATAGMSMKSFDVCPGCAGIDHSTAMSLDCSVGLCSGAVAILPAHDTRVAVVVGAAFLMPAFQEEHGITIPPDPGPPRLLSLS